MVKRVDSDALGVLNRALGLTGAGSPITELQDGVVDQVLSVGDIVRRGRTLAGNEGIFYGRMLNEHAGAGTLTTTVNVYNLATTSTPEVAPYPVPMPKQFDVWILAAILRLTAGAASTTAVLNARLPAVAQGWGVDDGGGDQFGIATIPLAFWDTIVGPSGFSFGVGRDEVMYQKIGLRLPRSLDDAALQFVSTSVGIQTYLCDVILGVFPVALGQDVLV